MRTSLALIGSAIAIFGIVTLLQLEEMAPQSLPSAVSVVLPTVVIALLFLFGVVLRLVLRDWSVHRAGFTVFAASAVTLCVLLLATLTSGLADGFLVVDLLRAPEAWILLLAPVAGVLFMSVVSAMVSRSRRSPTDFDSAHS